MSRYDLYSALNFAPAGVAIHRNRHAIPPFRALAVTKFNPLYKPSNCGFQVQI